MKRDLRPDSAWALAALILFAGCLKSRVDTRPVLEWKKAPMVLQDSGSDSLNSALALNYPEGSVLPSPIHRSHWESRNAEEPLSLELWRFATAADAYLAWQALPGDLSPGGDFKLGSGSQFLTHRDYLVHLGFSGSRLLSSEEIANSLVFADWKPRQEPEFAQIFLQQNRLKHSGVSLDGRFLGWNWQEPLYGMSYRWFGDTAHAFLAGPQDSAFWKRNPFRLNHQDFAHFQREGIGKGQNSGQNTWFWRWGDDGVVGLQGCASATLCSTWVEKQYQVLGLFARDAFFRRKSPPQN